MIDPMLIPIAAIALPVILVPIILGLRQARIERELEHAERMKALELGRTLPQDEGWWSLPRISVAIGAGVPAVVFFCAWQGSESLSDPRTPWVAASLVGLAAVVSGSTLAARHYLRHDEARQAAHGFNGKPLIDEDAYDFVSRRS
jgi:hypothetical protein